MIVYSSCDEVELYINGRFVACRGSKAPFYGAKTAWYDRGSGRPTTLDLHLTFDVPYEPGELKAVGYRYVDRPLPENASLADRMHAKERIKVTEETVTTTGAPAALEARVYQDSITVDGVAQIEIHAKDAAGRYVPDASNLVRCRVEGDAKLLGLDSGDLMDHTLYGSPERRLYSGCLLAVVRPDKKGTFTVRFESEGLEGVTVEITAN